MSFANLEWYGWIIFVLTLCSLWSDMIVAGVLVAHADKVPDAKDSVRNIVPSVFWSAVGIAVTLYMLGGSK